jgi:DNA-directed RNA polymerase subunit RPC12/RpoP
MKPEPYNDYPCPNCEADVRVSLPAAKYAECEECGAKLEIHPDAEFYDGMWHDLTELSVVDPGEEHRRAMLEHMQNERRKTLTPQELADAIIEAKAKHPGDFPK